MIYSQEFYESIRKGIVDSAQEIVPVIYEIVKPQSEIDVGCGEGFWLEEFRKCGDVRVVGIEGGILNRIEGIEFRQHDMDQPLLDSERFDLVVSLEVAEHLKAESADIFVDSLCGLGDNILFSAAIPGQGGMQHANEQWPEYCVVRFQVRGYVASSYFRWRFWNSPHVEYWYSQNMVFLAKRVRGSWVQFFAEPYDKVDAVVHPRMWNSYRTV